MARGAVELLRVVPMLVLAYLVAGVALAIGWLMHQGLWAAVLWALA